jgi:SAM-dependent methyltransferase
MAERGVADEPSFKELEQRGWGAKADNYNAFAGQITVGAVAPLLDAAGVTAGMRVLDVACGPGYVADGATARGAHAIGIDFAANMVAEAQRRYPRMNFVREMPKTSGAIRRALTRSSAPSAFSIARTPTRRSQRPIGSCVQMGAMPSPSGWVPTGTIFLRSC